MSHIKSFIANMATKNSNPRNLVLACTYQFDCRLRRSYWKAMMIVHLQKRAAICLKPPRTCAICNNAWHKMQQLHKKTITCGIVLDSICTTGTTQLPCHVGSARGTHKTHTCWSMRSHVVSYPRLLIYASRKCDNSAIPVGQASCGEDMQVVDKFLSCSLETLLCNIGGLVPISPPLKKGSQNLSYFHC